jgi:hypothetical protein
MLCSGFRNWPRDKLLGDDQAPGFFVLVLELCIRPIADALIAD